MKIPTRADVKKGVSKSLDRLEERLCCAIILPVIIIFSALLFAVNLVLTALAGNPSLSGGLFIRGITEVSNQFPLNITPAGFTFSIWGVIYLLQGGWIVYTLCSLCRRTDDGPVYLNPPIFGPAYFLFFNASTVAVIGWLFMWDRLLFLASFVFLLLVATSLAVTTFIGASNLARYRSDIIDQGRGVDVFILATTMVNGLSTYATWTTIATLINLGTYLVYKLPTPLANETASIICLSILGVIVVVYAVLDSTLFRSFTRYNLAPFLVVIWALIGVLAKNFDLDNVSTLVSIGLLVATTILFIIKLTCLVLFRVGAEQYEYKQMKFGRCVTPVLETKEMGL